MSDIDIRKTGRAGRITLTRPKELNALTHDMGLAIERALDDWETDDAVELVIIDAEGLIFVDIGSRGEVLPARPVGATVPFRRWIHTHPMDAYWSSTDLDSLSAFSPLITEAMVLGMDQYKRTTTVVEEGTPRLGAHPPLSNWSSEPTRMYQAAGARNE